MPVAPCRAGGLMQIKPRAWRAYSRLPYRTAVWDWRSNLSVGPPLDLVIIKRDEFKVATHMSIDYRYPMSLAWLCHRIAE